MNPKLSIIIPTLNEESTISETLQKLKSGLTLPHEIIVSDGKSSDRTAEIARKYADKVIVYSGVKRQTIAEGRNDGAKLATGEFLAFMDADCSMIDPNSSLSYALGRFEDKGLVALVPWVRVLPNMATTADKVIMFFYNYYLFLLNNFFGIAMSGGELQMMRKIDFEKVGGYDPKLVASEDVDLLQRLAKSGKTRLDKNLVVFHTGRRAHKIGWPKLLYQWSTNAISMMLFKSSSSKEWDPIR